MSEDYTPRHVEPETKGPLLTDSMYDKVKPTAALILPALSAFWMTIATIWHLPAREEVAATITAINIFLGVILLAASQIYKKSDARYDGVINVTEHENGLKTASLELKNYENPADIVQQNEAIFRVTGR